MQDERGMMHPIDREKFDSIINKNLKNTLCGLEFNGSKAERALQVGDVFKVRQCTFEVTEIKMDGIFAKGIPYSDWLDRKAR